jgi:hypothetical protein
LISGRQHHAGYNSDPTGTVFILVGIGIFPKCMFYFSIDIWKTGSGYNSNATVFILVGIGILPKCMFHFILISGRQDQGFIY